MAMDPITRFLNLRRCSSYGIFLICVFFTTISLIYMAQYPLNSICYDSQLPVQISVLEENQEFNLLRYPSAWNHLTFPLRTTSVLMKIALFVKKWPEKHHAGGLERHAMTLYLALARRGHEIHVFTASSSNSLVSSSFLLLPGFRNLALWFHLSKPTAGGYLDQAVVWDQFQTQNSTGKPFDIVHTESVALRHTLSRNLTNLVATWHGIAYESIHSDIIQELARSPEEVRAPILKERLLKVVEEVKFFHSYAHHVAISDHVGDVLKRIYMIPEQRVHIILNGIDQETFKPDASSGKEFKKRLGIPKSKALILGIAGRLVKDKGHPLMFEALKQIFAENSTFQDSVMVVVAGDGPWGSRYKELGTNLRVVGTLEQTELAKFYNAIDVFVNPTLRAQGMDNTLLESMLTGKPLMATKLASITETVIVSKEIGYTFSPNVASLKIALYKVWEDGRRVLEQKGKFARERSLKLFSATKMAAAYERLFLCIANIGTDRDSYHCSYQP